MVKGQTCPKVFVGDPYQQIYGFRGAVNALHAIEPTHTFYLTKVFCDISCQKLRNVSLFSYKSSLSDLVPILLLSLHVY